MYGKQSCAQRSLTSRDAPCLSERLKAATTSTICGWEATPGRGTIGLRGSLRHGTIRFLIAKRLTMRKRHCLAGLSTKSTWLALTLRVASSLMLMSLCTMTQSRKSCQETITLRLTWQALRVIEVTKRSDETIVLLLWCL